MGPMSPFWLSFLFETNIVCVGTISQSEGEGAIPDAPLFLLLGTADLVASMGRVCP